MRRFLSVESKGLLFAHSRCLAVGRASRTRLSILDRIRRTAPFITKKKKMQVRKMDRDSDLEEDQRTSRVEK